MESLYIYWSHSPLLSKQVRPSGLSAVLMNFLRGFMELLALFIGCMNTCSVWGLIGGEYVELTAGHTGVGWRGGPQDTFHRKSMFQVNSAQLRGAALLLAGEMLSVCAIQCGNCKGDLFLYSFIFICVCMRVSPFQTLSYFQSSSLIWSILPQMLQVSKGILYVSLSGN